MSYRRNDPASISFGRRLIKAEAEAAAARQEVAELKKSLPAAKQMTDAASMIKAQRTAAKQLMARPDATMAELQGIDATALTPALQEQLRHSLTDAAYRQMDFQSQPFRFNTPDAELRFRNWQTSYANQEQVFQEQNSKPEENTPYQKWLRGQQSFDGLMWNREQERIAQQRRAMLRRAEADIAGKAQRPKGIDLGKKRGLDK